MTKVYVVMSNDYPDSVFAKEAAADQYCAEKKIENKHAVDRGDGRTIYYRSYEFEVRK